MKSLSDPKPSEQLLVKASKAFSKLEAWFTSKLMSMKGSKVFDLSAMHLWPHRLGRMLALQAKDLPWCHW